ncbi:AraC family transcriptional regulator, regulatory protein of adaptative response / methylated-DNA-[protein]-cysteine methyltransferase [Monaibacterium marinum]|uniref:methylated-DNA--[protein]-cysteine S-methyltransferase n=1 Tax=Pontivivens marinum TaxID=1690039 RepID=A0A2C9CQ78_9RHOB|nr:trifunctional transcriptional activator/DNA repair protein Ada/methylated-DNA--[protein]-cysteine S-methyltransferase [Monaibacterium marinum]SOH92519.1 AraC family transcriptional regulator, regulatory protein of adaptative response / methylated-DNA-[protein]-cysteine methyltransferase [Monaibacterium marinum]
MLFDLPDDAVLYTALLARDAAWEGRAYVGVTSTGVFCRMTCPARKPKRENCRFHETVAGCLEAGFRPCRRCHPLACGSGAEPSVAPLVAALEADPARRWSEDDVVARGFDPSTVRRAFKRQFGITFLEMARLRRLRESAGVLAKGGKVIEAQLDAGYDSPAAFRAAFAKLLGQAPAKFAEDALLRADWIDTPLGAMVAVSDRSALHLLEFSDRPALPSSLRHLLKASKGSLGLGRYAPTDQVEAELGAFFAGQNATFRTPLALEGSEFTRTVWQALVAIPAGETRAYADIAREIGRPSAVRAVARANGANRIALVVPCHRVIGSDGALTGYGGGLWRKRNLIELERGYARA